MAPEQLPPPAAILLDLDGTVVDSVDDIAASANTVRAGLGADPLPIATVRSYVGDGARRLMERCVRDLDLDTDEALRRFRAHYGDHCVESTACYPGVLETLHGLAGIPLAIVSNKPQDFTERVVDGLGLRPHFQSVVGARRGVPVKPDPALLEIACAELGIDVSAAWMVGDSRNDVLAAKAVGAVGIGVRGGIADEGEMLASEPDRVLAEFAELLELSGS